MVNHPRRSRRVATVTETVPVHDHESDYAALLTAVQRSFDTAVAFNRLFTTDAEGLSETYLSALSSDRQIHTCTACRRFIEGYGALVTIHEDGTTTPAMWSSGVPEFYQQALAAMGALARRTRVTGVFLSSDTTWGTPQTRDRAAGKIWHHLSVQAPVALRYRGLTLTPGQAMAAKREDFNTVARALAEFTPAALDEALRLLETESLYRSERFVAPVKWLRALCDRPKGRFGENVLWRAIADAPDGFCHPRASVVGSLLEDIAAGLPFTDVKSRFDAKMHPLRYQRPQAAPAAGNIKAAEALVEKLGLAPALQRRFAVLDEIETVWRPKTVALPAGVGGVFSHLTPKGAAVPPALYIPAITITWEKFHRTVLDSVEALDLMVPSHGPFICLTGPVNADAPPLFKWDNQIAWYVYPGGSLASQWNLPRPGWTKMTAVSSLPTMWGARPQPFLGEGMIFVLDGCVDSRDASSALFPECLRGELHEVRATIEAHSQSDKLSGREKASACGYDLRKQAGSSCTIRALSNGRWTTYKIDRWD